VPRKTANGAKNPTADIATLQPNSKSKSNYDRWSVGQSVLVSGTRLGPVTNFSHSLFDFVVVVVDSFRFVDVGTENTAPKVHLLLWGVTA
jgi:hypothetical protein